MSGEAAQRQEDRRDLSGEGIAFRDLIDEVVALVQAPQTITQKKLDEVRSLVREGTERFGEDRVRVHSLNQILAVVALIEVDPVPPELGRLVLDIVRRQRPA